MDDCKPTPSPFHFGVNLTSTSTSPKVDATLSHQLVGSLLYLTHTHPDLSFVVDLVARYMKTPHESHWKETKRTLHYVHGTIQFVIHYSSGVTPLLVGFTDSNWSDNCDDQKSSVSYVFILGSGPVTWACNKTIGYFTFFRRSRVPSNCCRCPFPTQPIGWKAMSTHRIFPLSTALRTSKGSSISLSRNLHPHKSSWDPPSLQSGDQTSRLCEVNGLAFGSRIPETRQPVNADLFLLGFSLSQFRHSRCRTTCFTDPRIPICRNSDTRASLTFQHPVTSSSFRTSLYRES
jgi:hypothetical protein